MAETACIHRGTYRIEILMPIPDAVVDRVIGTACRSSYGCIPGRDWEVTLTLRLDSECDLEETITVLEAALKTAGFTT